MRVVIKTTDGYQFIQPGTQAMDLSPLDFGPIYKLSEDFTCATCDLEKFKPRQHEACGILCPNGQCSTEHKEWLFATSWKIVTLSQVVSCEPACPWWKVTSEPRVYHSDREIETSCGLPLAVISECHQLQRLNSTRNLNRWGKSPVLLGCWPSDYNSDILVFNIAHLMWESNTTLWRHLQGWWNAHCVSTWLSLTMKGHFTISASPTLR